MENVKECVTALNPEENYPTILKRPIIITSQKWNSILKHVKRDDEIKKQTEEERKYREYLKEGSRELTKTWTNAIEKSSEFKPSAVDKKKEQYMERLKESERIYGQLKEKDLKIRQEQIAKAQQMIHRLKPGPRDLESAALFCEVLKGREIQQNINAEFNRKIQEHNQKLDLKMQLQVIPWIEEDQKRMVESRKRNEEYKSELIKTVKNEERRKTECAKRQTEVEKKMREQADEELKAQIDRERAYLMRKKEAQRKNALEAMKMVEQRRMREKFENEIDNQIITIVSNGKRCINKIKIEKDKIAREEKQRQQEIISQKIFAKYTDTTALEEQRMQQAMEENNLKLDQQERDKIQKEKMLKAARIRFYVEEMEKQKLDSAQKYEQFRWEMANRLKNEEINEEFEKLKAQEKIKKVMEVRAVLSDQIQEKQAMEQKQKEIEQKCGGVTNEKQDDEFFMGYANKLIEDAKKKSRPLLPLLKAVEKYKKDNEIDIKKQERKHLKSNVPINMKPNELNCDQPRIKYDLDELKQLNPRISHKPLWAINI